MRHIGPTAQDFAAAFGVGEGDTHIATVDADGVALAAIQGLHQMVQEKDARIDRLEEENAALRTQLATHDGRLATLEARAEGQRPAGLFGGWLGAGLALAGAVGLGVSLGRRHR